VPHRCQFKNDTASQIHGIYVSAIPKVRLSLICVIPAMYQEVSIIFKFKIIYAMNGEWMGMDQNGWHVMDNG